MGEKEETGAIEEFFKATKLDGLIKTLKKLPAFKQKLGEAEEKVRESMETQAITGVKPEIKSRISVSPLFSGPMEPKKRLEMLWVRFEEKPPLVEVFEEKNGLRIVAELPTAKEEEIEIKLDGKRLLVSARDYTKTIELPYEVKPTINKTFTKNVLEIMLEKA